MTSHYSKDMFGNFDFEVYLCTSCVSWAEKENKQNKQGKESLEKQNWNQKGLEQEAVQDSEEQEKQELEVEGDSSSRGEKGQLNGMGEDSEKLKQGHVKEVEKGPTKDVGEKPFVGNGKSWKLRRGKKRQLKKGEKKKFQNSEEEHPEKECSKKVEAMHFKNVVKEHFKSLEKHSKVVEKEQVKKVSMYRGRGRPRTAHKKPKVKDVDLEMFKESKSQSTKRLGDLEMMTVEVGSKNDQVVSGEKNVIVGLERRMIRARSCKRIVNVGPIDQIEFNKKEVMNQTTKEKTAPPAKRKRESKEAIVGLSCGSTLRPPCLLCPLCHKVLPTAALFTKHIGTEHNSCRKEGRTRTAAKCCCSLHAAMSRVVSGGRVGWGGREGRRAREFLEDRNLLQDTGPSLVCSACLQFAGLQLEAGREEGVAKVHSGGGLVMRRLSVEVRDVWGEDRVAGLREVEARLQEVLGEDRTLGVGERQVLLRIGKVVNSAIG